MNEKERKKQRNKETKKQRNKERNTLTFVKRREMNKDE